MKIRGWLKFVSEERELSGIITRASHVHIASDILILFGAA